ncbi:diacylglycerol O-acyltransferase 2-like [Thamnophis elegans]|uniref:diacylglycerol O-acyltransferase 2-like n=1 Tax=Thamnophis elegans TaxID=35005 RepID=UPI0013784DB3|nr:diacylglycerol O-acyltransferase 2-like [Thamnophis elegans]
MDCENHLEKQKEEEQEPDNGTGSSILSTLQDLSWLSKSKVEKQLQVISVLQWVVSFLMMGIICTIFLIYMLCTDCWIIAVLYLVWYAFDWNTPSKAGRRSQWIRNWAIWRYFRDYFPIRVSCWDVLSEIISMKC